MKLKCIVITVSVCDSHNQTTAEGCSGCAEREACCSGNDTNPICQSLNAEELVRQCCKYYSAPNITK